MTDPVALLLDAHQRAWAARDPEALTNTHHADGVIVSPIFRTVRGRPAILHSYQGLFAIFPDWHYQPRQAVVDATRVAQPFVVQATHTGNFMGLAGTGRRVEIEGVCFFELTDGLIAHERRYYDFTGMLIQLGVLRAKPAEV
ncbi:MAG TPA: ester cyclase [Gemmatimonadales bacterium]|nr:ester cyclase [Gemmatimonadales bacterium]